MINKTYIVLYFILITSFVFIYQSEQAISSDDNGTQQKQVLLINSYHQGFEWTDNITTGVIDWFKDQSPNISLTIENMDSKNHSKDSIFPDLFTLFKDKYQNKQPDVIISSDNNALAFLIKYRDSLFPGVPIVFCGVNNFSKSMLGGQHGITGVVEKVSDLETIDMAIKMNPKAKRLFAVACSAPTSKEHIKRFSQTSKTLSDKIDVIILHDLTKDEFAEKFSKIKNDDIILNYGFHYTRDEYTPTLTQAYNFMRKYTNAPIYTLWRAYADSATAGIVIDGHTQGELAAQMSLKILQGTPADRIPIITESPNIPVINYQDLKRIQLTNKISLAPESTLIINRPHSVYDDYKFLIWGITFILFGMLTLIFLLSINIRKRRQAENGLRLKQKVLQKQKENLKITLSSIAEGVIATDIYGHIQQINPVAEQLTGWDEKSALKQPISEVFSIISSETLAPTMNTVEQVLATGNISQQEKTVILVSRDSMEYQISSSSAPIKSDDGEITGAVLVFRDITNENAIQRQLHQSQKMDAIGQLAGGIAHDFNNMLGGIVGAADLVKMKLDSGQDPSKFIDVIVDSATRATSLTRQLLAFSRQQPKYSTPIDSNLVLKDSVLLLSNIIDKRIKVQTSLYNEPLNIIGDPSLLQSAFMNLLINASQAMPEGGDLYINSHIISLDKSYCDASTFNIQPGDYAEIKIRDTGQGISQENLGKIFEPFFTTKEVGKGTGLGLAAVFGTVQQHSGAITVYSEEGKGTCFHVMLPLTVSEQLEASTATDETLEGEGTILLVDDEEIMQITAEAILDELGYKVLLAKDGKEGFEVYKENYKSIDLVVLDMVMPIVNGRDCFWNIKRFNPHAKVIISSGFSRPEELVELKEGGLSGFINKPFKAIELGKIVKDTLRQ